MQLKGLVPKQGLPHAHMCDFLKGLVPERGLPHAHVWFSQGFPAAAAGFCW